MKEGAVITNSTLKTIQVISKIAKIISKIGFIFCIVGASMCFCGIFAAAIGTDNIISIGNVTIKGIFENNSEISMNSIYAGMVVSCIMCIIGAILCKFSELYFKHELDDGTPFTIKGAMEIRRLGILNIALSLGGVILTSIIHEIMSHFMSDIEALNLDVGSSVDIGIMFIIMSLIFKYGAEIISEKKQKNENGEEK